MKRMSIPSVELARSRGVRQSGASLLFALITLVALALAATALVRSVDTGAIVLGNLGAKKATSVAADRATQLAIGYLVAKGSEANRNIDEPNMGYYASAKEAFDMTGFGSTDPARKLINWEVDGSCAYAVPAGDCDPSTRPHDKQTIDTAERIEASWVITRLCSTAGMAHDDAANNCVMPPKVGFITNQGRGQVDYNQQRPNQAAPVPFYRIVVRVTGPRNAVTYTETIVNL